MQNDEVKMYPDQQVAVSHPLAVQLALLRSLYDSDQPNLKIFVLQFEYIQMRVVSSSDNKQTNNK
jgi:hypothetical protein